MGTYSKKIFSASVDGRGVPITATSATGTTIHTAATGIIFDEVHLALANRATSDKTMTVEWGTSTDPALSFSVVVPASGSGVFSVVDGFPLASGQFVRVYGATGDVVAYGYVNRLVS